MRFKQYALFSLILLAFNPIFGQQSTPTRFCGYAGGKSPWLEWYQQHRDEIAQERGTDTAWLYVPMTLHLVGTDNGTGYYKLEQALRDICEMNEHYEAAHIRYYLLPGDAVRYHANSAWYDHQFYPGGDEMINENHLPGRMNAFVVSNPSDACGYYWQDAIVIGANCTGVGNITWPHEAGHFFSLPHTFNGWEDTSWDFSKPAPLEINGHAVEKTDSSNCSYAGDGFCDTPPDYLSYRWTCDGNKQSPVIQRDPNGVEFRSDATLFMGYPWDGCASGFSAEQIEAMRENLYSEHSDYLQITEPLAEIDDDEIVELISPIDSQNVQFNNVTLSWNPVPGATIYVVEVGLAPALSPRFYNQAFFNTTSVTITSGLPNNRILRWRVRAYSEWDICQPNSNAQVGIFKTKNLSATNELQQVVIAELAPNPVAVGLPALFTITSDDAMDAALNVTDASGRLCQTQHLRLLPGENRFEIPTEGLSAGLYVVTLQNEKGAIVKRLAVSQ